MAVDTQTRAEVKHYRNYIGGEWRNPVDGDWIAIEDPATAEPAFSAPRGQKADIDYLRAHLT